MTFKNILIGFMLLVFTMLSGCAVYTGYEPEHPYYHSHYNGYFYDHDYDYDHDHRRDYDHHHDYDNYDHYDHEHRD